MTARWLLQPPRPQEAGLSEAASIGLRYEGHDKSPLLVHLHGADACGEDPEILRNQSLPLYFEHRPHPFYVLSPQASSRTRFWSTDELRHALDAVLEDDRIDRRRVYLTGGSLGAVGIWLLGPLLADYFAAMAPLGGAPHVRGERLPLERLGDIPVWAFHRDGDGMSDCGITERAIDALNMAGGNGRLTMLPPIERGYPGEEGDPRPRRELWVTHDIWAEIYQTPGLYEWFLLQEKPAL